MLDTADGERVIVWHVAPRGDQPVVLYFHGNGGALRYRVDRFRALTPTARVSSRSATAAMRGSSGRPTEDGLLDGCARGLCLRGAALSDGSACALGRVARHRRCGRPRGREKREKPVGRLVLEAPFASAVDVAASVYPFVPVRWLMKDQFRSDLRIGKVTVPVLIVHGDRDTVIPIQSGERLYALIKAPKRVRPLPRRRARGPRHARGRGHARRLWRNGSTNTPHKRQRGPAARAATFRSCVDGSEARPARRARASGAGAGAGVGFGFIGSSPSRCMRLRASLRARRIASAFSRAFFSEGFS